MMSHRLALGRRARVLRGVHTGIAAVELGSLGYVWTCALTGRRDRLLGLCVGTLVGEGVALVIGRGNCPLGPLQRRWGDSVPLFELVLPPRAAKAAVPVLAVAALAGVAAVAVRPSPGQTRAEWNRTFASLGRDGGLCRCRPGGTMLTVTPTSEEREPRSVVTGGR